MQFDQLIKWSNEFMIPCFFKETAGIACPGCGLQRGVIQMLEGNIMESLQVFPPLLPMIFMISILLVGIKFQEFKGRSFLLFFSYGLVIASMVINFAIKTF